MKKFHQAKPLSRSNAQKKEPRTKIVVVCEGKVTEPHYFEQFKAIHRNILVDVKTIGGCGVPVSVVERAIEERDNLRRAARKLRDSFEAVFEVWAAFDRDEHPCGQVQRAMNLANQNGVFVAYSNPCFEVWGLMHYSCYSRPGHHREAQAALKLQLDGYCHERNPIIDPRKLEPKYFSAVSNAQRAINLRSEEGTENGDPSTSVFLLTERIRLFGRQ